MSVGSLLRSSYLRYFSQPAHERTLYQAICGRPIRSLVEIGLDLSVRTPRLIEVASPSSSENPLRYTGIDQFDARPAKQPPLTLKQAFAALRGQPAKVQLVPGEPAEALARIANSLAGTDLLVLSSLADSQALAAAWIWVPRMLTPSSLVFAEQLDPKTAKPVWRQIAHTDIQRLATAASKSRRAAA